MCIRDSSYSGAVPNEKITWGKLGVDTPKYMIESVSYTHLDVYKRQYIGSCSLLWWSAPNGLTA